MGKINIGVFIPNGAQTLDVATIDVLGSLSKEYLGSLPALPASITASAPSVSITYITSPAMAQAGAVPLTSNMVLKVTHSHEDAEVAPGKLDVIVVPGPHPDDKFAEAGLKWLREHFETPGVDVLSVCTGLYICAAAGIADGRSASGPRGLQDDFRKKYPKIRLVGDDQRWARDGRFWSSGGVTNGNDLMAAYVRESERWPNKGLVELGLKLVDVGDRGQFYGQGKSVFIFGFVWQLLRAWLGSSKSAKKD